MHLGSRVRHESRRTMTVDGARPDRVRVHGKPATEVVQGVGNLLALRKILGIESRHATTSAHTPISRPQRTRHLHLQVGTGSGVSGARVEHLQTDR